MIPIGDGNCHCEFRKQFTQCIETDMIPIGDGNSFYLTTIFYFQVIIETDMIPIGDGNP